MAGTTPEGLPYPTGTDLVRDGDNAIQALATATGTTHMYPLNTAAQRIARVGVMMSASLVLTFDAGGRTHLDVSGTFSSVVYAHAISTTYPIVISVPSVGATNIEFFGQFPNGSNVTGAVGLMLMIVGVRK